jgi:hypothetical protein
MREMTKSTNYPIIADTLEVAPAEIFNAVLANAAVAGIPPKIPHPRFARATPSTSLSLSWSV